VKYESRQLGGFYVWRPPRRLMTEVDCLGGNLDGVARTDLSDNAS
jgi:hypothetical protein